VRGEDGVEATGEVGEVRFLVGGQGREVPRGVALPPQQFRVTGTQGGGDALNK